MNSTAGRIRQIEDELAGLPAGYISKKMIHGKERFYRSGWKTAKLKSRYIKAAEFDAVSAQVERRKQLQEERKALMESPEGVREQNLKRKAARNMLNITGEILSEDMVIAKVKNGEITEYNEQLLPLYLKRTKNVEGWLSSVPSTRTGSIPAF